MPVLKMKITGIFMLAPEDRGGINIDVGLVEAEKKLLFYDGLSYAKCDT